jgi:hypothetical protein
VSSLMFSEMNMYILATDLPLNWPVYTVFLGPWNRGIMDVHSVSTSKSVP